jgi:hypothetical protein
MVQGVIRHCVGGLSVAIFLPELQYVLRTLYHALRLQMHVLRTSEHALRLLASMPFFKQPPCCLPYFFSTAKRSKQERPHSNQFFYPSEN